MYTKLHQRDTDLFQRCVGAQASNDPGHAKIFANECAEIRKIAKVVLASQLALERVILRLETVEEFSEVMVEISPLMSIVKETKSKISGIVPQVATELDEVNNLLGDLTDEAGDVTSNTFTIETNDDEAKKVLEETGIIAEQKVRPFPRSISGRIKTTGKVRAHTGIRDSDARYPRYGGWNRRKGRRLCEETQRGTQYNIMRTRYWQIT